MEEWRAVVGYEGHYLVSTTGRVWSIARRDSRGRKTGGRLMSINSHPSGHQRVKLSRDGEYQSASVHRLVAEAFLGPGGSGYEVCHWDDNPSNNNVENLRWGTRSDNLRDRVRNGIHLWASKTQCPQGHPYDEANTYHTKDGRRMCRECLRIRNRESRAKRKAS